MNTLNRFSADEHNVQWSCILCVKATLAAQNDLLDADILTYWDIIKHSTTQNMQPVS